MANVEMVAPTRILIVEDNAVDVRMIRFALEDQESWDTETTVAGDGEEAVNYLLAHPGEVDLVILDLNLPKRDGTEVLQSIRSSAHLARMPVIVLSSSPHEVIQRKVEAVNLEANCYLTKPFSATEFLQLGQSLRECYQTAMASARKPRSSHAS